VNTVALALDVLLAVSLPAIALAAVLRRDRLQAVMLLFGVGALLAVVWGRLGAPDVAMVEAALGAGVTGVLFVSALAQTGLRGEADARPPLTWIGLFALALPASVAVGVAMASLPREFGGLVAPVLAETPRSGASHPVTAVLLNFRGYDTLLEIAVLVLAVLGAWAARGAAAGPGPAAPPPGRLLATAVRILVPLMVVVSGFLLWVGASEPGGAFQAGTVLGATLVLASLAGVVRLRRLPDWTLRAVLASGFAVFLLVAAIAAAREGTLLRYPAAHAAGLLLAIEAALTVSIAFVVAALFEGQAPAGGERPEGSR
jgi:multisubunit Na+/H+ antiporter MnhB subunit